MTSPNDIPTKTASGRYTNVDFTKATNFALPVVKASYNRRDVLLFAAAIGCRKSTDLHFLYELHPNFAAFPTFPINLPFKQTSASVYDFFDRALVTNVPGVPPFDPQRSVDGERGIRILRALPASSKGLDLEVAPRIVGYYDKGGNMVQEMEQEVRDARTGVVYCKLSSMAFGIGQGGYGGPEGPRAKVVGVPGRVPDRVSVFATTEETPLLYRLCGDYNPIHADDGFAKEGGFKGAFMQGLGTWNIAACGVLREWAGSEANRLVSFRARFKDLVWPGDVLETRMWGIGVREDGIEEVVFQTVVQGSGRVVLSNGFVEMKKGEEKSRL
ncbi:Thioesterase/thiol ester dehydrase-isomerase [Polyplosphaeria fusca]|uniref:Thioesterase/thiol ester dehydrase-isomerase n=1 Tax=Polyplosphaeria fusca TaxID=682080 RepID=A0A9P4R2F5_9PLEO|nr:Thioesterase/thiol ester dehydrase-isomerase [Polyplosphaeria fusca]